MAADVLDEDQWLYGSTEEQGLKLQSQDVASEGIKENGRDSTPTLEEMDILDAPVVTAIDSKPVLEIPAESALVDEPKAEESGAVGGVKEEDDSESDDEDDVQITIGEIKTDPVYNRQQSYTRLPVTAGGAAGTLARKVDLEAVPQINGQPIYELDLEAADKPWKLPGADITDYFNYGFTEETWRLYCEKQRKMKNEVGNLNKIAVQSSRVVTTTEPSAAFSSLIGVPTLPKLPLPVPLVPPVLPSSTPAVSTPTSQLPMTIVADGGKTPDGEGAGENGASDGRATPELSVQDVTTGAANLPLKPPLIPPPILPPNSLTGGLPPPFGFPPPTFPGGPSDQNLAAAAMAAAMFGGLRPPDAAAGLVGLHPPPQLPQGPGFPPLPPPGLAGLPGGLPDGLQGLHPPFPGMPFPPPGDHGPLPFDDRGMPPMPPDMLGHAGPFPWDPAMGPPPPELFEGFRRGTRSPRSHSSTSRSRSRSRSSSYDRYKRSSRRHRRRSRSRSRDRDRHRSSRHHRDHHRSERSDRHDRDKDRDRDSRRSRRDRDDRSRHERSSRRHRSASKDNKEEERSSRKEKQQKASEQDNTRESRSRSRSPS